jgi:hypothetical protein
MKFNTIDGYTTEDDVYGLEWIGVNDTSYPMYSKVDGFFIGYIENDRLYD